MWLLKNLKEYIYKYKIKSEYNIAITSMKLKNQDLHDSFIETLSWINLRPDVN